MEGKMFRLPLFGHLLIEQDLTDCVNIMAANLTEQVRTIAHATVSFQLFQRGTNYMADH